MSIYIGKRVFYTCDNCRKQFTLSKKSVDNSCLDGKVYCSAGCLNTVKDGWKLTGHSYQIADTGDYDGHYEITNGKISLLTQDDDDESLQPIVDALNNSGCKFYQDDWLEFENKILKDENTELRERVKELESGLSINQYTIEDMRKSFYAGHSLCDDEWRDKRKLVGFDEFIQNLK